MRTRTSPAELQRDAVRTFIDVARGLGLSTKSGARPSVVLVQPPEGSPIEVEISAASVLSSAVPAFKVGHTKLGTVHLVVADQIPTALRPLLDDAGIGWLDRRGHMRFVAGGLFIDTDIPSAERSASPSNRPAISGRSGLAAAAALLLHPDDPMGVSEISRLAKLNASSISRAMAVLAKAQLAEQVNRGRYRPLVPELFWALADVWPRDRATLDLTSEDLHDPRIGVNADDLSSEGWAMAGERGAVSWGAPLVLTGDYPTLMYVPSEEAIRIARAIGGRAESTSGSRSGPRVGSTSGSASGSQTRSTLGPRSRSGATAPSAVEVAIDPIGLVTHSRFARGGGAPLAHPLFCALDLSAASRDREALDQWTPPEGFTRVW